MRCNGHSLRAIPATPSGGGQTPPPSVRVVRGPAALALVLALWLAACAGPGQQGGGAAGTVYVAAGVDGAVHRLDAATARPLGPPLPVPGSPQQLAPAPGGGAVVLSLLPDRGCQLTHLVPPGGAGRRWTARPILSLPPPITCAGALLAGDGERFAALAVPVPGAAGAGNATASGGSSCRLIVVDLSRPLGSGGPGTRDLSVCPPHSLPTALAAGPGGAGPVLYVGLWHSAAATPPRGRGTVLAVDPATGAVLARTSLAGAPERLVLSGPSAGAPSRLYAIEGAPGPDERNPGIAGDAPPRWRLLPLDPTTLASAGGPVAIAEGESDAPAVAIPPHGATVYVLARAPGQRTALLQIDPTTGATGPATLLPGEAVGGLLATDERVLVPDGLGHGLWVIERRTGRLLDIVPAGRGPVAITVSPPP